MDIERATQLYDAWLARNQALIEIEKVVVEGYGGRPQTRKTIHPKWLYAAWMEATEQSRRYVRDAEHERDVFRTERDSAERTREFLHREKLELEEANEALRHELRTAEATAERLKQEELDSQNYDWWYTLTEGGNECAPRTPEGVREFLERRESWRKNKAVEDERLAAARRTEVLEARIGELEAENRKLREVLTESLNADLKELTETQELLAGKGLLIRSERSREKWGEGKGKDAGGK